MACVRAGLPGRLVELRLTGTRHERARRLAGLAAWRAASSRRIPGWAIVSAGLSPVVLTAAWLIADPLQPPSYSPVRQTVSVLAGHAGTDRWIVTGALLLVGGCHLVTAVGLPAFGTPARILLALAGLSSIGIAASPEPAHGSTPQHLAWTALGAVIIAIWPAFTARRGSQRPMVLSVRGSAAVTAVFAVLLSWLIIETQGGADLGLAERVASSVQISWPLVIALALRRAGSRAGRAGPSGGQLPEPSGRQPRVQHAPASR
jgi:Protein of unknown function (DUF998)